MSTHTRGPWEAIDVLGVWVVGREGHYLLAKIPAGSVNAADNARLMAAAPDLLAALIELLDSQRGLDLAKWQAAVAAGHAAIAKARGE